MLQAAGAGPTWMPSEIQTMIATSSKTRIEEIRRRLNMPSTQPAGADKAAFMAREDEVQDLVFGIVLKYGGSISAEHGIGVAKRERLPLVKDKTAIELMRTIKQTLDPNGILNPGKVL